MATQTAPTDAQINAAARAAIKARSVKMQQLLQSGTVTPGNPVLTINPRNVGLILGFWVNVTHVVHNGSAVQIDLTQFGPLNALSQIQFNDFNNTTRLQTPGWHLGLINSIRGKRPFGAALVKDTGIATPVDYGNNWTGQISAPATIAAGADGTVNMWYWVPLAYSDDDLRGAIYANIINVQAQLLLSMPGSNGVSVCVASGTDSTQSMYVGDAGGSIAAVAISSTTYQVYQYYYDQLPVLQGAVLLPVTDLATIYELKVSIQNNIPTGQDFGYQYPNFRDFLSTLMVYVNNGATGARGVGGDINYLSLQAANTTNLWKKGPDLLALEFRNFFGTDLPPGCYYFGSRQRPISTTQYGNMQLILNAKTASSAYQLMAVEDFALIQQLSMAGSLPTS